MPIKLCRFQLLYGCIFCFSVLDGLCRVYVAPVSLSSEAINLKLGANYAFPGSHLNVNLILMHD